jgi:hypothetical protein
VAVEASLDLRENIDEIFVVRRENSREPAGLFYMDDHGRRKRANLVELLMARHRSTDRVSGRPAGVGKRSWRLKRGAELLAEHCSEVLRGSADEVIKLKQVVG